MSQPYSSTLTDKSATVSHSASQTLCEAASWRYFLFIHNCDASNELWVNLAGGTAAEHTAGSILIPKGTSLQIDSGAVPSGKITAIAKTADVVVTCYVMENPSL